MNHTTAENYPYDLPSLTIAAAHHSVTLTLARLKKYVIDVTERTHDRRHGHRCWCMTTHAAQHLLEMCGANTAEIPAILEQSLKMHQPAAAPSPPSKHDDNDDDDDDDDGPNDHNDDAPEEKASHASPSTPPKNDYHTLYDQYHQGFQFNVPLVGPRGTASLFNMEAKPPVSPSVVQQLNDWLSLAASCTQYENDLQRFVVAALSSIQWAHDRTIEDTHDTKATGSGRPDITIHQRGSDGHSGVCAFGELKMRGGASLLRADTLGQVLSYAQQFLLEPSRQCVYGFLLSPSYMYVLRFLEHGHVVQVSPPFRCANMDCAEALAMLLELPPVTMGISMPNPSAKYGTSTVLRVVQKQSLGEQLASILVLRRKLEEDQQMLEVMMQRSLTISSPAPAPTPPVQSTVPPPGNSVPPPPPPPPPTTN